LRPPREERCALGLPASPSAPASPACKAADQEHSILAQRSTLLTGVLALHRHERNCLSPR
jgi:hypothetical protein